MAPAGRLPRIDGSDRIDHGLDLVADTANIRVDRGVAVGLLDGTVRVVSVHPPRRLVKDMTDGRGTASALACLAGDLMSVQIGFIV